MAYIGTSAVGFVGVSGVQSQAFNGNGSNTVFTLNRQVSNTIAIEVLVNNVQQSPYDASYSVSGTTLTFSEAPTAGSNNVYVTYLDQPIFSSTQTPASVSDMLNTSTGGFSVPSGNTGQRPTGNSYIRFNTELTRYEGYDGTSWTSMRGATGAGGDEVFSLNGMTVTTSYTIPTNMNAMTVGPVTLANSVIVTIPSGSRWVVL